MAGDDPGLFAVRLLPTTSAVRLLLHAHLEAHDHLAIASDLPDGSVEVSGPIDLAAEIAEVAGEIARAVGALHVAR